MYSRRNALFVQGGFFSMPNIKTFTMDVILNINTNQNE